MRPPYLFLESSSWTTLFWLTYIAFFFSTMWVHTRERGLTTGDNRDRGSRALIYFMTFLGVGLAFAMPYVAPQAKITLPQAPFFYAGIAMIWAGAILYPWSAMTLGANFRTSVQLLDGQQLVTRGPYRILRHPAYTAGILACTGIGLAIGNWASVTVAPLAAIIAYARRIHVEEAALAERFGEEFTRHKRRTWAVIPLVW
jgi:protein-S-isoprenylcysteine O-methyltransferase Ste14